MQLRVRQGKGAKERVLPLSRRLLQELEAYWRPSARANPARTVPDSFWAEPPINR
jgi:integrase